MPARMPSTFDAAGTIFVGGWSAQAAGDYVTGSNHVLPTGGAARFRGGSQRGGLRAGLHGADADAPRHSRQSVRPAIALAEAEGLLAHAASIRCDSRLE